MRKVGIVCCACSIRTTKFVAAQRFGFDKKLCEDCARIAEQLPRPMSLREFQDVVMDVYEDQARALREHLEKTRAEKSRLAEEQALERYRQLVDGAPPLDEHEHLELQELIALHALIRLNREGTLMPGFRELVLRDPGLLVTFGEGADSYNCGLPAELEPLYRPLREQRARELEDLERLGFDHDDAHEIQDALQALREGRRVPTGSPALRVERLRAEVLRRATAEGLALEPSGAEAVAPGESDDAPGMTPGTPG